MILLYAEYFQFTTLSLLVGTWPSAPHNSDKKACLLLEGRVLLAQTRWCDLQSATYRSAFLLTN
jgi:hypothetical protein